MCILLGEVDRFGSTRVVVDGSNGEVLERNDYYAFGERWNVSGGEISDNRYRYNGKELQTTGDLPYIDYGARMYSGRLGRWFGVDPLAEKYYSHSPYTFCANNPIKFLDPNGMSYTYNWQTGDYEDKDGNTISWDQVLTWIRGGMRETVSYAERNMNKLANSSDPLTASLAVTGEFVTGLGPEKREFDSNHSLTKSLASSNMTKLALKYFWEKYKSTGEYLADYTVYFGPGEETGPFRELWADRKYTTPQFTGTSKYSFTVKGENLVIRVLDSKTPYSLFYHIADIQYSRDKFPIMGRTVQYYNFTIPLSKIPEIISK